MLKFKGLYGAIVTLVWWRFVVTRRCTLDNDASDSHSGSRRGDHARNVRDDWTLGVLRWACGLGTSFDSFFK